MNQSILPPQSNILKIIWNNWNNITRTFEGNFKNEE